MKKILTVLGIATLLTVLLTACTKNESPQSTDLFVGTYQGKITYVSGSENQAIDDGSVTVAKIGDNYNFRFSNGLPNIDNITLQQEDSVNYINVGNTSASYIRINANTLDILYVDGDAIWTADCTR